MVKKKPRSKLKLPRGEFLINDQFGRPIHRHDTIHHRNGMTSYVDHVWELEHPDEEGKEIYVYTNKGENWAFENVSADPWQS